MDRRTREYLRGRFGDYYRSATLSPPPAADAREWGHIPFTDGGTTMVRHQSLLELGELDAFLAGESPRHVYFSAARYDDPATRGMDEKGWQSADLVFDLDADHLPSIDPERTSYEEMLRACKGALLNLIDILHRDFDFETQVVFSGSRGYHVHVRDPSVRDIDAAARREVVDYVRGADLDTEGLVTTTVDHGTTRRVLRTDGGWGRRVHERLVALAADLREMEEKAALARLREYDRIGTGRAETLLTAFRETPEAVERGNLEAGGPGVRVLVEQLAERVVAEDASAVDEPVTTDVNRLIRLPGSLHGGTGLAVRRLDNDEVAAFDPLVDAVPERFTGQQVRIEVTEPSEAPVSLDGGSFRPTEGEHVVREPVGVFLMARERARKVRET